MNMTDEFVKGRASMRLDERLPEGHVVLCAGAGSEHSFLVHRLGLSVECPTCGRVALSVDLVADFYKLHNVHLVGTTTPTNDLEGTSQ